MEKFINLTPHEIKIVREDGSLYAVVPPSGTVARVKTTRAGTFPFFETKFGGVENLPAPDGESIFIVSALVRQHPECAGRSDVWSPGELVRNDAGQPVGCKGLTR